MKFTAIALQFISLVISVLVLLKVNEIFHLSAIDSFLPVDQVIVSALWLSIVYGLAIMLSLVLPLSYSGRDELLFGAGFGVCLGLLLVASIGMKIGVLQCIASFAIGSYARQVVGMNSSDQTGKHVA
jgi:hypothetical protein